MDNMGRIAIFSDVHGNLEALQTVLEKIAEAQVDRIICLGDMVGYGADPNACIERVREVSDLVLAGNHDWAAVGLEDPGFFNPVALAAIQWTAQMLSDENTSLLRSYQPFQNESTCCYAHASPVEPELWHYLFDPEDSWSMLKPTSRCVLSAILTAHLCARHLKKQCLCAKEKCSYPITTAIS